MRFEPGSNSHAPVVQVTTGRWPRPALTNRMREFFTYGSVGGAGRKPGPYPAGEPAQIVAVYESLALLHHWLRSAHAVGAGR